MAFFVFGPETGLFSSLGLMAKSLVIDDVIDQLGSRAPSDVIFREKPLLLSSYRFRGAKAVLTDSDGRMFFTEVI